MSYFKSSVNPRDLINEFRHNRWFVPVFVALIIGAQAWGIVSLVNVPDKEADYEYVLVYAFSCNPLEFPNREADTLTRNPIKWWLACASYHTFDGNIKVLPIIFNIGLMPLVYLITTSMTKDRLIGFITLVAFILNPLYSDWKASGVYDQAWVFFLFLGIWLSSRKLAIIPYLASFASKSLALMYLPAFLYTSYMSRKRKHEIIIFGAAVIGIASFAGLYLNILGSPLGFYPERWEEAVYRNISVLWQVIPFLALFVVLNRSFIPKTKVGDERTVYIWIVCALLQNPLIYFFTLQDTYSYRYQPLALFMSILLGMTLVNIGNWYQEIQLRKIFKSSTL